MVSHGPSTLERYAYAVLALLAAICSCCGLAGCKTADEDDRVTPVKARWAQICMRNDKPTVRTSDESCETAPERFHWLYVFQDDPTYSGCPPVGGQFISAKLNDGWITATTRPVDGTVGRVNYNGGYGIVLEEFK